MNSKWQTQNYTFTAEYFELTEGFFRAVISHNSDYGYLLSIETVEGLVCLTPNGMINEGLDYSFKNLRKLQTLARRLLNEYNANRKLTLAA